MVREKGVRLTIARKTFPSLRATAMKDFFNVLREMHIYREEWHNKTEFIYKYGSNEVDFLSVDEPSRIRSRRRDYLWMNEANEFSVEDFEQLNMRTEKQVFMDYNPSHLFHWIYDRLQTRKDCIVIPSTFLDNPFLSQELVKEIENYKDKDQNYWRIYGLGLRGVTETLIYTHWQYCDVLPENPDKRMFGLDFGFNNQTALVEVDEKDKDYYWHELLYEKYITNADLIRTESEAIEKGKPLGKLHKLVNEGKLSYNDIIYADSAEPGRIEEIMQAGFNVVPAFKTEIKNGVDIIKSHKFFITKESINLSKEAKSYSWKTKDGKPLEEPVKENDHLLDAGRYAIITDLKSVPTKLHFW